MEENSNLVNNARALVISGSEIVLYISFATGILAFLLPLILASDFFKTATFNSYVARSFSQLTKNKKRRKNIEKSENGIEKSPEKFKLTESKFFFSPFADFHNEAPNRNFDRIFGLWTFRF